jgi:hypothetical protein
MARTDSTRERTSFPATRTAEQREPSIAAKRFPLSATRNEPKRRTFTEEEVRLRAYEIYQRRGGAAGNDLDDWLQAERELREN